MAHSYVIRIQSRNLGKTAAAMKQLIPNAFINPPVHIDEWREPRNSASKRFNDIGVDETVKFSATDLPLLVPDRPADFIRFHDDCRQLGHVFSQRRNLSLAVNHPICFYVEFPGGSANFFEISATKLCGIIGDSSATGPFSRMEVAHILERMITSIPFPQLLAASHP
jgi:hypothetical protein